MAGYLFCDDDQDDQYCWHYHSEHIYFFAELYSYTEETEFKFNREAFETTLYSQGKHLLAELSQHSKQKPKKKSNDLLNHHFWAFATFAKLVCIKFASPLRGFYAR